MNRTLTYLDNGSTTQLDPAVLQVMQPYLSNICGNPSSEHRLGVASREVLDDARRTLAQALGAQPTEIVFTSGATESNALALRGITWSPHRSHMIVSGIEHSSILGHRAWAENLGFEVSTVLPLPSGHIDPESVSGLVRPETALVCIQHANNEIGTIQPIETIGQAIKHKNGKTHFLVDAVQSFTKVPLDIRRSKIDYLSVSSHKIHGPKGVGALFVRRGLKPQPLFAGGEQENRIRPGTENVPAIAGFAAAVKIGMEKSASESARLAALRDHLVLSILREIPDVSENGTPGPRLPHHASVNFHGARAETLVHLLESEGVIVSSGAACHASSPRPTHVLRALGVVRDEGTLRFSLSRFSTQTDVDTAIEALKRGVALARTLR